MAKISQQINESDLNRTVNWYFSPEGLHAANDRLGFVPAVKLIFPAVYAISCPESIWQDYNVNVYSPVY